MKRLSPACKLLLFSLWHKYKSFCSKHQLSKDGSFYYDDERLANELDIDERTIARAKKTLQNYGYIKFETGKFRGVASKYWILRKPDKKSPFESILKPDKMSLKDDNLSIKGYQNVTPNKEITNEINNNVDASILNPKEEYEKALDKRGRAYWKKKDEEINTHKSHTNKMP